MNINIDVHISYMERNTNENVWLDRESNLGHMHHKSDALSLNYSGKYPLFFKPNYHILTLTKYLSLKKLTPKTDALCHDLFLTNS